MDGTYVHVTRNSLQSEQLKDKYVKDARKSWENC